MPEGGIHLIYLDNAATTRVDAAVLAAMLPFYGEQFGNCSEPYALAREAKRHLNRAREKMAACFHAKPDEIYFTSCGSEGDNWALMGAALASRDRGRHIISTRIEHHAVLHTLQYLEELGFSVTYLPVDRDGFVSARQVAEALRDDTILVSVMAANNEIGTIQPIHEIGEALSKTGVLFHTDAVQAAGALPLVPEEIGCDLMSVSAHKFNGPKGVGALYIKKGTRIDPYLHGGAQESGLRAGTENLAGIVGMAEALSIATENLERKNARIAALRDALAEGLLSQIPGSFINGSMQSRLSNNLNITVPGVPNDVMLMHLDMLGIAASAGSACTAGSREASHVLLAIGLSESEAKSSLRFSLSRDTTREEIARVLSVFPPAVQAIRNR